MLLNYQALMSLDPSMNALLNPISNANIAAPAEPALPEQPAPPKKAKREKPFLHYNLTDFYELRKVKYTLVFDELHKKQLERSQFIYTLDLKDDATISPIVEAAINDGHKRMYIDLGLHIKQMQVREIAILEPEEASPMEEAGKPKFTKTSKAVPEETQLYGTMPCLGTFRPPQDCPEMIKKQHQQKSWYVSPMMQTKLFAKSFDAQKEISKAGDVSKDLNSVDFYQRDFQYYTEQNLTRAGQGEGTASSGDSLGQIVGKKPELHISKFIALKMRKQTASEVIQQQLRKVLKILVSIGQFKSDPADQMLSGKPEAILNFGIRAIDYKQP